METSMPSIDVPLMAPIAVFRALESIAVTPGLRLAIGIIPAYPCAIPKMSTEGSFMARFSLRATLLAGAFALVAAPSLAQVMEVAIDQSPAGLDPHIITAFASFMVVNGAIY